MGLTGVLRRLGDERGVTLRVSSLGREGEGLRVVASSRLGSLVIHLSPAHHQQQLFGEEPEEEALVGSDLTIGGQEIDALARRGRFLVVFDAGAAGRRSYLCGRGRLVPASPETPASAGTAAGS